MLQYCTVQSQHILQYCTVQSRHILQYCTTKFLQGTVEYAQTKKSVKQHSVPLSSRDVWQSITLINNIKTSDLCLVKFSFMYLHYIHPFIPLSYAEFDDSLPFSGASSIPLCYVLFPATLPHQLFFHPLSPIHFLVYLSILLFPHSYIILFWEFYFLPLSVHVQNNIIYLILLSLL